METASTFGTTTNVFQNTWRNIPEERSLHYFGPEPDIFADFIDFS
jgi:hypothetical protein